MLIGCALGQLHSTVKRNHCDNFPDTVIIGLRIEMSVILDAFDKNLLIIIIIIIIIIFNFMKNNILLYLLTVSHTR